MQDPLKMTAVEFEIWVRRHLEEQGCLLREFRTEHLETLDGTDGDYVMDVTARFEAIGVDFLVLIECKRYTAAPVEREEVQALNAKMLATAAQKAIVFTTSTFRTGAVRFARTHGIALVQVTADKTEAILKAWSPRYAAQILAPDVTSLVDFLHEGQAPQAPPVVLPSQEAEVQAWVITQLRDRLDYFRVLVSRGHTAPADLDGLRADIAHEEDKLRDMLRQAGNAVGGDTAR